MLAAMFISAFLCIGIGSFPGFLYAILPFAVEYNPYDTTHVLTQMQLLFFGALSVLWLMKAGIYPPELKSVNLDAEWSYRWLAPRLIRSVGGAIARMDLSIRETALGMMRGALAGIVRSHDTKGIMARTWTTGSMIFWVIVLLGTYLMFYL